MLKNVRLKSDYFLKLFSTFIWKTSSWESIWLLHRISEVIIVLQFYTVETNKAKEMIATGNSSMKKII